MRGIHQVWGQATFQRLGSCHSWLGGSRRCFPAALLHRSMIPPLSKSNSKPPANPRALVNSRQPTVQWLAQTASIIGYYDQTYAPCGAPAGANLGVALGGWGSATNALSDAAGIFSSLVGAKYLDVDGGNTNGRWTSSRITELHNLLSTIKATGYAGVCYDIEEGDSGLAGALTNSFALAKVAGLKVLVTVSHSVPYGIPDADTVMGPIASSANVDNLSPQLCTSGLETTNDFTGTRTLYKTAKAAVVMSIVKPSLYSNAQTFSVAGHPPVRVHLMDLIPQW
jgi:hypothetical protein